MSCTASLQAVLLPDRERFNPEEFTEVMCVFGAAFRPQGIETPLVMLHMALTLTHPMGAGHGALSWSCVGKQICQPLPAAFTALLLTKHIKSPAWKRGNCSGYFSLKYKRGFGKKQGMPAFKKPRGTSDAVKFSSESQPGQASYDAPVGYHSMSSHHSTRATINDIKRPFSLHYHLSAALWPSLQTKVGTCPALAVL